MSNGTNVIERIVKKQAVKLSERDTTVLRYLFAIGMPLPVEAVDGIYGPTWALFDIDLPDNATTAEDLTDADQITDPGLVTWLGASADNPDIIGIIDGAVLRLPSITEDEQDLLDIMASVQLRHQKQGSGRDVRFGLGPHTESAARAIAVEDTNTTVTQLQAAPAERIQTLLPHPIMVDFSRDTFEVSLRAAVDMGAALPAHLYVHGTFVRRDLLLGLEVLDPACGIEDAMAAAAIRHAVRTPPPLRGMLAASRR